jgi:ketosteroid isomerase-like protein
MTRGVPGWTCAAACPDTSVAMSEENVAIIRRAFDAYTRGDIDAVLELCSDDILVTQAEEVPGVAPQQRGHAGVLEAFGIWPEQWDDFQVEIKEILADPGDQVVVATRQRGRGKQSGVEVEADFTFLFSIRDEKIAEWRIFVRESQALDAVGERG